MPFEKAIREGLPVMVFRPSDTEIVLKRLEDLKTASPREFDSIITQPENKVIYRYVGFLSAYEPERKKGEVSVGIIINLAGEKVSELKPGDSLMQTSDWMKSAAHYEAGNNVEAFTTLK